MDWRYARYQELTVWDNSIGHHFLAETADGYTALVSVHGYIEGAWRVQQGSRTVATGKVSAAGNWDANKSAIEERQRIEGQAAADAAVAADQRSGAGRSRPPTPAGVASPGGGEGTDTFPGGQASWLAAGPMRWLFSRELKEAATCNARMHVAGGVRRCQSPSTRRYMHIDESGYNKIPFFRHFALCGTHDAMPWVEAYYTTTW